MPRIIKRNGKFIKEHSMEDEYGEVHVHYEVQGQKFATIQEVDAFIEGGIALPKPQKKEKKKPKHTIIKKEWNG